MSLHPFIQYTYTADIKLLIPSPTKIALLLVAAEDLSGIVSDAWGQSGKAFVAV